MNRLDTQKARRGALQVYELLREDILWLRIEPGSALDEMELARRFEVSRTPIREALLLLSGEGFVKFLPNRTSIVAQFSMDNAGEYFDTLLILARAAARSAAMSGKAKHEPISEYLGKFDKAIQTGEFEGALRICHSFLRSLADMSGNIFLRRYLDQILDAGVRMYVLHYFSNATGPELRSAVDHMSDLANAVLKGDPAESDRCMARIIEADNEILVRSLRPKYGYDFTIGKPKSMERVTHD